MFFLLTNLAAEVASLTAADLDGAVSLSDLRSRYKHTLPVFLVVAAIQKQAKEPLHSLLNHATNKNGIALAASVTASPSADEQALLKDEVGRENLVSKATNALNEAQEAYYVHSISLLFTFFMFMHCELHYLNTRVDLSI